MYTLTAESILVKMRLSSVRVHDKRTYLRNKFVWRQLGVAFFGAATSVAALFVCAEKNKIKGEREMKKRNLKKIIFCVLIIATIMGLAIGLGSCAVIEKIFSNEQNKATNSLVYEISADGTYAAVIDYTGRSHEVIIPENYKGLPVKSIGEGAFAKYRLTSITIPGSITSIGEDAFVGCDRISVYVDNIESWCEIVFSNENSNPLGKANKFYLNGKLTTELTIPKGITSISDYAFYGCSVLTSVTIGNSVTSIGSSAFKRCNALKNVTIPESVINIGNEAFRDCDVLADITIPGSIVSIGNSAFEECSELASATIGGVTICDGVGSIGYAAFKSCPALTNVRIGNSITSIGSAAFSNCTALTSVTIGDNVTNIGPSAFGDCSPELYTMWKSGKYIGDPENPYAVLVEFTGKESESAEIHDKTKVIAYKAFLDCKNLTSLTIPSDVTGISEGSFYRCFSLTSVELPYGLINIGNDAFSHCNLTRVTIPKSVISIGDNAFEGCEFKGVVVPRSVISIGSHAFPESIETIHINDLSVWCTIDFSGAITNSSKEKLYLNEKPLTNLVIPNGVTGIGDYAFCGFESIESIIISDSVTGIGNYAFRGCSALTSVTIGDSVTSIGDYAFTHCSSLKSVKMSNSIRSIGDKAFFWCDSLTEITIPDGVISIGESAFYKCSLTNIEIPTSVTSIGESAFGGCDKLVTITVNEGNPMYYSENDCIIERESMTLVRGCNKSIIPNNIVNIAADAFSGCKDLTSVTIGDSVINIGNGAFSSCKELTNVIIGNSVAYVDDYAFAYCDKITDVYYTGSAEEWEGIYFSRHNNADLTRATIHYNYVPEE